MHARYYSSLQGRFLTPDPFPANRRQPQSWNRYAYVLNTPINLIDPRGLDNKLPTEGNPIQCGSPANPCNIDVPAEDPSKRKPKPQPKPRPADYLANVREFERFKAAALAQMNTFLMRKDMPLYHGRSPDYVTLTLGANSQYAVGGGGQLTLDAYGRLYVSPYFSVGTPGKGFALVAGWLRQSDAPLPDDLDSFISGLSGAGSIAFGGQYSYTWGGPGSGYADEVGIGFPGIGGSLSYGFGPAQTNFGWRQ